MAANRVIGRDNALPWKIPEDLAWFKQHTLNKTIVMGRKTWESLYYRPLPQRKHIIITGNKGYQPCDHKQQIVDSIQLMDNIHGIIQDYGTSETAEIMIMGGASIYQQFLPYCHKMYLTTIQREFNGDAYFPMFNPVEWDEVFLQSQQTADQLQYDFRILQKISS